MNHLGEPVSSDSASSPGSFYRDKKVGRLSGLLMILVIYGFASLFIAIWFYSGRVFSFQAIFGLFGVFLVVFCLRGVWSFFTGPVIHFVSFQEDSIRWGYLGRDEKSLSISNVESFHWSIDVDDELDFAILKTDGKRKRLHYIDLLIAMEDRSDFQAFLTRCYPGIPLDKG